MATYVTWPGGGGGSTTAQALKTAGADVSVSASAAPTGASFVLITTGATTATWQDVNTLNLVNNLRINANTTNTASVSASGGGTVTDGIVLGKSTTTVTGAGSANKSLVLGTGTTVSATTGSVANSVFVGQGHTCASGASDTSGAIAVGSAITIGSGATSSITLGGSITNGTANSFLVAPGGNPSLFVLDPQYGNFFFTTRDLADNTNTTYTLTPNDLLAGRVFFIANSTVNVTLPLGSDMDSYVGITQNLWVGMSFVCYIGKVNGGNLVWSSNTGFSLNPSTAQMSGTAQTFLIRRTGVNSWNAMRCG